MQDMEKYVDTSTEYDKSQVENIYIILSNIRTCLRKIYEHRKYGINLSDNCETLRQNIYDTIGEYDFDIDDEGDFVYILQNKDYFFTDIRGVRYTYSCILNKTFPLHEYKERLICYFYPDLETTLSTMTSNEIIDEMVKLKSKLQDMETVQSKYFCDITDLFVSFKEV